MTFDTKTPLSRLCYQLDDLCPPCWFTFSSRSDDGASGTIFVYLKRDAPKPIAKYVISAEDPLDYVVTKIMLQFSGGTVPA